MARRRSSSPSGAGFPSGSRMCAANACCSRRSASPSATGMPLLQPADDVEFALELRHRRNIEVAFEKGRDDAETGISAIQQPPYRVGDIGAVRVHAQILGLDVVS